MKPRCEDFTQSKEYAEFVEESARFCRCDGDCPCDGVLAGGLCDGLTKDDRDALFDEEDQP